jgi:hypothetical protein
MNDEYRGILRVRGILKLAESIEHSVVNEACSDALRYGIVSYSNIKTLCLSIMASRPTTAAPKLTQSHECIREMDEYQNHFNRMVEPVYD